MTDFWHMPESELLTRIILMIGERPTLLYFHEWDSRRDKAVGFPDLVIVGPNGLLFRELKKMTGKLSRTQVQWKWALLAIGADWALWTPKELLSGQVEKELEAICGGGETT